MNNFVSSLSDADRETLRRAPLFRELSGPLLDATLQGAAIVDGKSGDVLFNRGDAPDHFFVVLNGWVKVYRDTIDGEEAVLGIFTNGESIAEAAAFLGRGYPASAAVIEESRLLRIPTASFIGAVRSEPSIAINMLGSMSMHLHRFMHDLEQLQTQSAANRVIEFLLSQSRGQKGSATVVLPYDKMLLAKRLGMKPESLSRIWSRLRQHGVRTEQNRVKIDDLDRLRRYFELRDR